MPVVVKNNGFELMIPENEHVLLMQDQIRFRNVFGPESSMLYQYHPNTKDKKKIKKLRVEDFVSQPAKGCADWNPTIKAGLTNDEITVCTFEIMGDWCGDDWDGDCLRNWQAAGNQRLNVLASQILGELGGAMYSMIRTEQVNDMFKIAWMGSSTFGTDWNEDLTNITAAKRQRIEEMMLQCDGFWNKLRSRIGQTGYDEVYFVDAYDGGAINATDPNDVVAYFDSLIDAAPYELQYYNADMTDPSMKPMFLVSGNIFKAYQRYLTSLGALNSAAYMNIINGVPVPLNGVLLYNGFAVVNMSEWDLYWAAVGAKGKNAAAVFTVPQNLQIAYDAASLSGANSGYSLLVQPRPGLNSKGIVDIYSSYRIGMGISTPNYVVASWNTVVLP